MFLRQSQVKDTLHQIISGALPRAHAPEWAQEIAECYEQQRNNLLQIGQATAQCIQNVSKVGHDSLSFSRSLDKSAEQTQMIAAATEEMSATADEISRLGENARHLAETTSALSKDGLKALNQLVDRLRITNKVVDGVGVEIAEFVEQTKSIIRLTAAVNGIADQTNLLALNAAIEAARAGDHGRGFAVVAGEVRGLAARSAEASAEIDAIVTKVVNGAQAIFNNVKSAIQTLADSTEHQEKAIEVITRSQETSEEALDGTAQIATAATEQASVSIEMAQNIVSVDDAMNKLQSSFSTISQSTESIRAASIQTLSILGTVGSAKMTLTLAKSDHIIWVDKLYRHALYGDLSLTENELKDHHQCRLGKFLDGSGGQPLHRLPDFDYLYNQLHPKVHSAGIRLYQANSVKKGSAATKAQIDEADALMQLSEEVVMILDRMINQL